MLTVWVDLPAELPAEARLNTLGACSRGLGDAECRQSGARDRRDLVVRVASSTSGKATVAVRVLLRPGEAWKAPAPPLARSLEFSSADPELERWTAVGLVLASLVRDVLSSPVPAPVSASSAPNRPLLPKPQPTSFAAAGAFAAPAAPGLDERYGVFVSWAAGFPSWAIWPALSLRYAVQPGGPALTWRSLGLGACWRIAPKDGLWEWQAQAELFGEQVQANLTRGRETASGTQLRWGGRAQVAQALRLNGSLRLLLGLSLERAEPAVEVKVQGDVAKRVERSGAAAFLALGQVW